MKFNNYDKDEVGSIVLESTYSEGDNTELEIGSQVYNAEGTSKDKIIFRGQELDATLIQTWEILSGMERADIGGYCCNKLCTSSDKYDLVGAHVVYSKDDTKIKIGDRFMLIPLCRGCNSSGPKKPIILRQTIYAPNLTWTGKTNIG